MCVHCETQRVYCNIAEGEPIPGLDDGEIMTICTETRMLVATDGGRYERAPYATRINFCPMCGRDLRGSL